MSRCYKKVDSINIKLLARALRESKCFSLLFVFRLYIFLYIPFLLVLVYSGNQLIYKPYFFLIINTIVASILIVNSTLSTHRIFLFISFLFLLYILSLSTVSKAHLSLPCKKSEIIAASGTLVGDAIKSKSGAYIIKMNVNKVYLRSSTTLSAKGVLVFLSKVNYDLLSTSYIKADLKYDVDTDFFSSSSIRVYSTKQYFEFYNRESNLKSECILWNIRRYRIVLRDLIYRNIKSTLARLLLLGQCDSDGFIFKESALIVGCSHLLALSGMHLSYISSFFSFFVYILIKKKKNAKKVSKKISLIYPLLFVFIAGPLPSLLRSLFMYIYTLFITNKTLKRELVVILSFFTQLLLFPYSIYEIGMLLSYSIISSLFILNMYFEKLRGLISALLSTSVALIISYPLGKLFGGSWSIASIAIAPVATILISLAMSVSLLILIDVIILNFNVFIISILNDRSILYSIISLFLKLSAHIKYYLLDKIDYLETIIKNLFDWGIRVPLYLPSIYSGWYSYKVFLITLLTIVSLYMYSVTIIRYRRQRIYELELSIRFPKRNHSTT